MNILKRIGCVLFSICLIISLVSCGKDEVDGNVSDDSSTVQTANGKTSNKITFLSLNKEFNSNYEWCEDFSTILVKSECSDITLDETTGKLFPHLAKVLAETSVMRKRVMEEERENYSTFAAEQFKNDSEAFSTYVSTLDVQVRRADSIAVSILEDYYARDCRSFNGINYDTESGKELKLSDVFVNPSSVAAIVEKEIMSHIGESEPLGDTAVVEYFKNTAADSITWTLDYNGVTFFFNAGDIAPTNFGIQIVNVPFAKYPDAFVKKYAAFPDSFIMGVSLDSSFFVDTDNDGEWEEYTVSGGYDYKDGYFYTLDICSEKNSCSIDWYAHRLNAFYVKTEDNKDYVYVFSENDIKSCTTLSVFEIKKGNISFIKEINLGMQCKYDSVFSLPTNPDELYLFDYEASTSNIYLVGQNGLPQIVA